jgi:hypothetical protein
VQTRDSNSFKSAVQGAQKCARRHVLGHEQTSRNIRVMSVIPLKADIHQCGLNVCLVPLADIHVHSLEQTKEPRSSRHGRIRVYGDIIRTQIVGRLNRIARIAATVS